MIFISSSVKIAPVHFFQPDFIAGERIFVQYAIVSGYDDDALEKLHELGGGVVTALAGCTANTTRNR